jgi:peptide-methionine (S)-S-oxide reductase
MTHQNTSTEIAVFGGGCFWCTEAIYQHLKGVTSVVPGYSGGHTPNPNYDSIVTGRTGHAEVIQVEFDPALISYEDLLTVFFATHDPSSVNKQGADTGTQYRSVVFTTSETQAKIAKEFIEGIESDGKTKIVTDLAPLTVFYPAEDYHQNYYQRNQDQLYCQVVIDPKLKKLKERFKELLV